MNRLLLILILTFSFQSWTKADDIRDFQVEGMSIGDSLLDFLTVKEIKQNTLPYFNEAREYYIVGIVDNLKKYDQVEIYLNEYHLKSICFHHCMCP